MKSLVALAIALGLTACAAGKPLPRWSVSTPAKLCGEPRLEPHDFCMPAAKVERWLKGGHYVVTDAAISPSGMTAPYKLRLQIDGGPVISAKFKRAPDALDAYAVMGPSFLHA